MNEFDILQRIGSGRTEHHQIGGRAAGLDRIAGTEGIAHIDRIAAAVAVDEVGNIVAGQVDSVGAGPTDGAFDDGSKRNRYIAEQASNIRKCAGDQADELIITVT